MKINQFFIKFCIALTSFSFFFSINLKAQDTTFTPSHLKVAEDMLTSMHVPSLMAIFFKVQLNNAVEMETQKMQPDLQKKFTKAMTAHFEKYGKWELVKNDIVKIYATEYSEAEIKELTQFYLTPLGKKVFNQQQTLVQKSMDISRKVVEAHQDELMKDLIKLEAEKN